MATKQTKEPNSHGTQKRKPFSTTLFGVADQNYYQTMQLKACINRFYTYVDRKKDQERQYLIHLGKRLQLLLHHPHQQPSCILARSQRSANGWYMTHTSFTVNHLAKIAHINARLIILSDEKSGTML